MLNFLIYFQVKNIFKINYIKINHKGSSEAALTTECDILLAPCTTHYYIR